MATSSLIGSPMASGTSIVPPNPSTPPNEPAIDNKIRSAWNDYLGWLKSKGLQGSPELDKGVGNNNKGIQMLEQYRKENPNTPLTKDHIIPIQLEMAKVKQFGLDQYNQGKMKFAQGTTPENYMRNISKPDGIPGSWTTSIPFGQDYLKTYDKDMKTEKVKYNGFATPNNNSILNVKSK